MQSNMNFRNSSSVQPVNAGKPTMPLGRQPIVERKISDPSSSPKSERYPVPSFFNYRSRPRESEIV
jgi:hypothetical protein